MSAISTMAAAVMASAEGSVELSPGVLKGSMKRTIVVVDAEPAVRSTVSTILKRAGYSVQTAAEFGEAMRIIESSRPDLDPLGGHEVHKSVKFTQQPNSLE